ncbi:hypothetical protein FQR65_LT13487 [Abscondita terminalis]|nr:hypothetical protein FQR65_LT13487 [Abscondita terminalis]
MVKGRRGRVSPCTFTKRKCGTRNGTSTVKNDIITDYFKCLNQPDEYKNEPDVVTGSGYDDEKFLMAVEGK